MGVLLFVGLGCSAGTRDIDGSVRRDGGGSGLDGGTADGGPLADAALPADVGPARWDPLPTEGEPSPRFGHASARIGSQVFVWGGRDDDVLLGDGFAYDLDARAWSPMTAEGAPSPRALGCAVEAAGLFVVWSSNSTTAIDGARYDATTRTWSPMTDRNAPAPRSVGACVSLGDRVFVWGGLGADDQTYGDGAIYDVRADRWIPVSSAGAPSPRLFPTAVWTGTEVIVWGGALRLDVGSGLADGAAYSPQTDTWRPVSSEGAPRGTIGHAAAWTGRAMFEWDGSGAHLYDPSADRWTRVEDDPLETSVLLPVVATSAGWVLVFGGQPVTSTSTATQGAWYSPERGVWRAIGEPLPSGRLYTQGVAVPGGVLVFGGAILRGSTPVQLAEGVMFHAPGG